MKYIKKLSFIIITLLLNSCGDNTTTPITKDVSRIGIDNGSPIYKMYSTDLYSPGATVYFDDNTSATVTDKVNWALSDFTMLYLSKDLTVLPLVNEGNSTLSISYKSFKGIEDSLSVEIIGLDSNTSWDIISDINTTGQTLVLKAEGNFTDGNNSKTIIQNISWTSSDTTVASISTATITDNTKSINTTYTQYTLKTLIAGDVNITATLKFNDMNASLTKHFAIY